MNKTFNPKTIYLLFSLIVMILISNQYLNKFENNFFKSDNYKHSSIFHEDSLSYIKEAEKIRNDIINGNSFLESGGAYKFSFLYPRIIYFYNKIINQNSSMIVNDVIKLENYKSFIFLQIFIFFLSSISLFSALSKILEKRLSMIIFTIFFFNPIIFQWHLTFLTESLFLSLLVLSISLLIQSKNISYFFLLGLLIGALYMLRTIALLYPVIVLIYLTIQEKKISCLIYKASFLFLGVTIVLLLIGGSNYLRSKSFYFTPSQSKTDLRTYIEVDILIKSKNFTDRQAREYLDNKTQKIINDLSFELDNEKRFLLINKKIRNQSIETIANNKLIFTKIILKSYFHSMLLNPTQVYFESKYQNWNEYKKSTDHKFVFKFRILITLIFFILSLYGLIISKKKLPLSINFFLFFSILYFFFTSCWLSNTRYFIPSATLMSIYFSIALDKIYEQINLKKLD